MRKTFRMFLTLALSFVGVMSVNALERISLQEVPFCSWDGYLGDAVKTGDAGCEWGVGTSTGNVYGDVSVVNFADLTFYSKLYVTVTEGTPRVLFNRLEKDGQGADTFEDSKLVDIPAKGWCTSKYQKIEGNVYIYDLKAITKDYGFCHLHAIKGANWANVTVESVEVEFAGKVQQVGWTEITTNADLDGDDMSNFMAKVAPSEEILPATVVDTLGKNGGNGIVVTAPAKVTNDYESQFWIVLPEPLPAGTKYRVTFDYKATKEVTVATQAHANPGNYIHYAMINNPAFTTEWQSYKYEGEITAEQAGSDEKLFQSIAFNLSMDEEVTYYFDNIRFEEYKYGVSAGFNGDIIKLDFGFDTNLPALVAACGKPRLMYPNECVSVKVKGEEISILSVEGFADGRFYVFLEEALNDDDEVTMTFTNPADAAYHLVYDGGPGGDVKNFDGVVSQDSEASSAEDAYSYLFVTPTLIAADPEDGSFNLPNSISEFKLTFDKNVDVAQLVAKLGKEALAVEPVDAVEGMAEKIILKRTSTGDLVTGQYELAITNILPEIDIFEGGMAGDTTLVLNIGKVSTDPNDTVRAVLPDYFSAANENTIPEGWYIVYDGAQREPLSGGSGGAWMKAFAGGGDFTRGIYTRTNNDTPDQCIVEYGSIEGYELTLEAGKKYKITYNLLAWKSTTYARFEIYNQDGEIVHSQFDECKGTANGASGGVVSGSNFVEYTFVPETTGNYRLRWTPVNATDALVANGMNEIVLGNPQVTYLPNAAGVVETQNLIKSLTAAKSVLEIAKADEKYAGTDRETLDALVAKYEAEYSGYTNPSSYNNAIAALDAAAKAMSDHRALCDSYYAQANQLKKVVDDNAAKKFAATELYAELKAMETKYIVKVETTETLTDPETGATRDTVIVSYVGKTITDGTELQTAVNELTVPVNTASKLFTEGASTMDGTPTTGVAAMIERLRLGAEALKSLGVDANDPLILAANNALTDDDDLAEMIKARLKLEIFGQLKNTDNTLFAPVENPETADITIPTYDLTVFVKNPNIYRLYDALDFTYINKETKDTLANVLGWVVPEGANTPGLSYGWGNGPGYHISDCSFQTWGGAYAVEQTIVDLPAGVYTVKVGFGERASETDIDGSFMYLKTSNTLEGEYADSVQCPYVGQAFPKLNIESQQVIVDDGMLTIGVQAGSGSATFFNNVQLLMCGAAEGFDYASAYQEIAAGVEENIAAPAQVLGIELYDLNGRRIVKAQQGVVIMRKFMSDGTIKVEKIIKK